MTRAVGAGVIAAFVGFASSFAVVLQGLRAVGATPAVAASGLMALAVAMGVCGIVLSLWRRMPISIAWSTPGAALLAGSGGAAATGSITGGPSTGEFGPVGFGVAVGAFLVAGALTVLAGMWRAFGHWVAAVPTPLANAMLAGVLFPLCLAPAKAVVQSPVAGLAVVAAWLVVGVLSRRYATPAAALVAVAVIALNHHAPETPLLMRPVLVAPHWSATAVLGIGLPLFVVTMASQNVPGLAVLHGYGYPPAPGPLLRWTGVFSLLAAPFGGHAVNLAAITAALCASEEAGPDPRRRYRAAVVCGAVYVLFGLAAAAVVTFVGAAPPGLIEAVAGLALLGTLGNALLGAMNEAAYREAAAVTLVVTASGVSFAGIGGAFWGLLTGALLYGVRRWRARRASVESA